MSVPVCCGGVVRCLFGMAAALLCLHDAAAQAPQPVVDITSPSADAFVSGATVLRAFVVPSDQVSRVTFFVNGRQVCALAAPPFECEWNAGPAVAEHQIRLAVDLTDGRRLVDVVRTRGLAYVEAVDVDAVQVTVTVTDDRGKPVGRLPRDAFRVYEDDRPQTITAFASEEVPLEVVVAVDTSGSMAPAIGKLRAAVREFLLAIPEGNVVTLQGFNDTVFSIARRATTPEERARDVDRLAPWGATALYDAILLAAESLGARAGRKAIVVFTDGEDSASRVALDDVERRLEASDITLYMIGQGRGLTHDNLQRIMQRLAAPTGGRVFSTDDIDDLQGAFAELLDELSNQYLLSYQTTNAARDSAWRAIRVEVDGYRNVRARDGYRVVPLP